MADTLDTLSRLSLDEAAQIACGLEGCTDYADGPPVNVLVTRPGNAGWGLEHEATPALLRICIHHRSLLDRKLP